MLCRYPDWFLRKNGFMGCGDTNAGGHEVQLTGDQHRTKTPEKGAEPVPPWERDQQMLSPAIMFQCDPDPVSGS